MSSSFMSPVLIPPEGKDVALERVPLSGPKSAQAYDEEWLQNLLYRHPTALPVGEFDDSFSNMIPVCQEMPTQSGFIDVVYVTRDGRPVIVEAKLWRNPEARRKVIGQILDYAKELSRWSFETFDAAVRRARKPEDGTAPKSLYELMGYALESSEAAEFHDSLTRSLRRGDMLLLIVGDGIREGAGAIAEFLERHGSLHFVFGLVEMAIYAMPGGGQLLQPRVLAQSSIIKRIVVDLRHEDLRVQEDVPQEADAVGNDSPSQAVLDSRKRFQAFWRGFLAQLRLDDQSQPVPTAASSSNQFFYMPKGSAAWVSAFVAESQHRAGVYLTFSQGAIGDRLFSALRADKAAIERELGIPVEWEDDGTKHWVMTAMPLETRVEESAPGVQRTLADWTNRYVNVFRPRLEQLVREET